jgi:DNA repair protein RadC
MVAADIKLTSKIKDGVRFLEIKFNLLDQLILTSESYYSFADEGLIQSVIC